MKDIVSQVIKRITPTDEEIATQERIANDVLAKIKDVAKEFPDIVKVEFGGSFAKNTWLPLDADIDIFVKFKESVSSKKFEQISKIVGFKALKEYSPYTRYSEHPYVEAKVGDTKINIVPCYDVKVGKWKSSADRSTFHTKFMKESLNAKMQGEIRAFKTFCKANQIYGAEMAKQGVSGYLTEVLVLEFGGFEGTVKAISEIEGRCVIGKTTKSFESIITIIDPIDQDRNLAAAISDENIGRLIMACRAFVEKPSLAFFKKKTLAIRATKYLNNILVVEFKIKPRSPDIMWGQIKKATTTISTHLKHGGFNVLRSKAHADKHTVWLFFLLQSLTIPPTFVKDGPQIFRREAVDKFIEKHIADSEFMWIKSDNGRNNDKDDKGGSRVVALKTREHFKAIEFVKHLLDDINKNNNTTTHVPQGLQRDFESGFRIHTCDNDTDESIKEAAGELIATDDILSSIYFN